MDFTADPSNSNKYDAFPIMAAGQSDSTIYLLLRNSLLLYEVDARQVNQENVVDLRGHHPVSLFERWTGLKPFKDILTSARRIFFIIDSNTFLLIANQVEGDNLRYDLKTGKGRRVAIWEESDGPKQIFLVTPSLSTENMYGVSNFESQFFILLVKTFFDDTDSMILRYLGDPVGGLCQLRNGKILFYWERDMGCLSSERNILWPVMEGFFTKTNFFLLGFDRNVYSLPFSVHDEDRRNYEVPLKTIPFLEFFLCDVTITTTTTTTTTSTPKPITTTSTKRTTAKNASEGGNVSKDPQASLRKGLIAGIIVLAILAVIIFTVLIFVKPVPQDEQEVDENGKRISSSLVADKESQSGASGAASSVVGGKKLSGRLRKFRRGLKSKRSKWTGSSSSAIPPSAASDSFGGSSVSGRSSSAAKSTSKLKSRAISPTSRSRTKSSSWSKFTVKGGGGKLTMRQLIAVSKVSTKVGKVITPSPGIDSSSKMKSSKVKAAPSQAVTSTRSYGGISTWRKGVRSSVTQKKTTKRSLNPAYRVNN